MRTTRALKDQARDQAYARRACPCGHLMTGHLELDRTDPEYLPLHFHCRDCDCVIIRD